MTDSMELIFEPLQELFRQFRAFLPGLLGMLVILVLGLLLSKLIQLILVRVLTAVKFDSWCDRMGFTTLIRKGNVWAKPSALVGVIVFWVLAIITLMAGLGALKVAAIDQMVGQFFAYMPRVISAVVILAIGHVLTGFVSRAVLVAGANSGFHYSKLLADAIRSLLTLLILAMAMEQLQIAPGIVLAAFSIIFGGIVVALAIAFGVGGIDAAKRMIEREAKETRSDEPKDDIRHI